MSCRLKVKILKRISGRKKYTIVATTCYIDEGMKNNIRIRLKRTPYSNIYPPILCVKNRS